MYTFITSDTKHWKSHHHNNPSKSFSIQYKILIMEHSIELLFPRNLTLSIQDIFTSYLNKLIEHNENLDTSLHRPSLLESLQEKADYFDVPDLDTKVIRHNNPHYWLQQDFLQVTNFQYRFFQNISLDDDTIPQIKVFSHFLLKFFRFNYQISWEQKDQNAYIHFPQVLTETELLPFLIRNDFKHLYYKNFTTLHTSHLDSIEFNPDFLLEQSESSDSRPYTNLLQNNTNEDENILSETPGPHINLTQEDTTDNENVIQHQPTTPRHPSQITHDSTESVQDILTNPLNTSSTVTDSNAFKVPTRNIIEHNTHLFDQANPSTLSVTNTSETQTPSIHHTIQRNYDPPPPPSNNSTHSTPHNSPQRGSSNTFSTRQPPLNESHFQATTPPVQSPQTKAYFPAQPPVQSTTPPILTINTLHTNPITNVTTSRTLSRPPMPLIQDWQDWHAFVQAFKKQFSSQKNAYYAQVEALSLKKKDNETVRHFALRVQQLVEKGWCNENASTINLKCNEIITKGLSKNLKGLCKQKTS